MLKLRTQNFNLPKVFCLELMAFYACNNGLLPIYFFAIHLLAKKTRSIMSLRRATECLILKRLEGTIESRHKLWCIVIIGWVGKQNQGHVASQACSDAQILSWLNFWRILSEGFFRILSAFLKITMAMEKTKLRC